MFSSGKKQDESNVASKEEEPSVIPKEEKGDEATENL